MKAMEQKSAKRGLEWMALAGLSVLVVLLVLPGWRSPIFMDDTTQFWWIALFSSWWEVVTETDCYGYFRPVKNTLYYLLRDHPAEPTHLWRLIVLGCYSFGMAGVYVLVRRFFGRWEWAFLATALWALSPTQVSTAIWMPCANLSLAVGLMSMALASYDKLWDSESRRHRLFWTAAAFLLVVPALLCYETVVAVGPLMVLIDWYRRRPLLSRPVLVRWALMALLIAGYLWLRTVAGGRHSALEANPAFSPDVGRWELFLSAPWMFWRHFSMWIVPMGRLEFLSTYIWGVSASFLTLALSWVFYLGVIGLAVHLAKRNRLIAFGIGWFLIAAFPAGNFVPIFSGPVEDYYVVFPGIGAGIALTGVIMWLVRKIRHPVRVRPAVPLAVLSVVVLWRGVTTAYFPIVARDWSHPAALYMAVIESRPAQAMAKVFLARSLLDRGMLEEAEVYLMDARDDAPWNRALFPVMGELAFQSGRDEEAIRHLRRNVHREPFIPASQFGHLRLGMLLGQIPEEREQARNHLRLILRFPELKRHAAAVVEMARTYELDGRRDLAVRTLERGIKLHKDNPMLRISLRQLKAGEFPKEPPRTIEDVKKQFPLESI